MAKKKKYKKRKKRSNPKVKTRKGTTNRWISGKAFKVIRKRGKLEVQVKR